MMCVEMVEIKAINSSRAPVPEAVRGSLRMEGYWKRDKNKKWK